MSRLRIAAGLCLVASATVFAASVSLWPHGSEADTQTMLRAAAGHPLAWTLANLGEEVSGLLSLGGALGLARWLSGRGRTLGFLGAIGAVFGLMAFSVSAVGNMFTLTAGQQLPVAQAATLSNAFLAQPYLAAHLPLFYLSAIGSVLLTIGAVRGRLVPWWVLILIGVGLVLNFGFSDGLEAPMTTLMYLPVFATTVIVGVALIRTRRAHSEPTVIRDQAEDAVPVLA